MTDSEKELKALVKQMNERIAKYGRKYGTDSFKYEKIVSAFKKVFNGSGLDSLSYMGKDFAGNPVMHTFFKTTSSGNTAIDATLKMLQMILQRNGDTYIESALDEVKNISEYDKEIAQSMEIEREWGSSFAEDYMNIKMPEMMKDYSNVKESVKEYLKNKAYDDSEKFKSEISKVTASDRPATYWELYKAICEVEGLDYRDIDASTKAIYNLDHSSRPSNSLKASAKTAKKNKSKKGVELGYKHKGENKGGSKFKGGNKPRKPHR